MDVGLIIALAFGFAIFSRVVKYAKQREAGRSDVTSITATRIRPPRPRRSGRTPESLEELLAEMINRQSVGQAPVTTTTVATRGWREESLEQAVTETGREEIDLDSESFAVAARRRQEVEARDDGWRSEDHELFDQRIRAAAPIVAPHDDGLGRLREAMLWSEVLGVPKGLQTN